MTIHLTTLIFTACLLIGCSTASLLDAQIVTPIATAEQQPVNQAPESIPSENPAVEAARLRLSHQGLSNPDLVSVVSITPTTWMDDCFGLMLRDACRPVSTPGYIVNLEREEHRYQFHTDRGGAQVWLATSSVEALQDAFIEWQYLDEEQCRRAMISTDEIHYGRCGEALLASPLPSTMWSDIHDQNTASYLKQTYAPFTAETIHGTLVFSGEGEVVATAAEQRAIAEWMLTRYQEATLIYLSADYGLKLFWSEESPDFCGSLWIYETGIGVAWNCSGTEVLSMKFLSAAHLEQFYEWLDSDLRWQFDRVYEEGQQSVAIHLQFSLDGTEEPPTAAENEPVLLFAHAVYEELLTSESSKCPVSEVQYVSSIHGGGLPVVGSFPIWMGRPLSITMDGPKSLPPYAGRLTKTPWFVHEDIPGDLKITGRQLDGEHVINFASGETKRVSATTVQLQASVTEYVVEDAGNQEIPDRIITGTEYQQHPIYFVYPEPGCYEFTAKLSDYTVRVVTEVLDK